MSGTAKVKADYSAAAEKFTLEMTLSAGAALKVSTSQLSSSIKYDYNIPFMVGAVPMGFKSSIGASATLKTPVALSWNFEKKYTTNVWRNDSVAFEKNVTDSSTFKAPFSDGFDVASWISQSKIVLSP